METVLQTPFNAAQVEILKLFSQGLSDKQLEELRRTLIAFRLKLLEEHLEKVAEQKGLTKEQIDRASWEHRRKHGQTQKEIERYAGKP